MRCERGGVWGLLMVPDSQRAAVSWLFCLFLLPLVGGDGCWWSICVLDNYINCGDAARVVLISADRSMRLVRAEIKRRGWQKNIAIQIKMYSKNATESFHWMNKNTFVLYTFINTSRWMDGWMTRIYGTKISFFHAFKKKTRFKNLLTLCFSCSGLWKATRQFKN